MISELAFLFKYQGPKQVLGNIRAIKKARSPIRGYVTITCFWTLLETGFMDELLNKRSVSIDVFCERHNFDPDILRSICRYLARTGYFEAHAERAKFTASGKRFWNDTSGVINIFCAYESFFKNLPRMLRKELSRQELNRHDDLVAFGFRETGPRLTFDIIGKLISGLNVERLVELGCGNIDLSLYLARTHPQMHFLGIDWDDRYLDQAQNTIKSNQLSERVKTLRCDLFQLTPAAYDFSQYQLVTAIDLFHGYFFDGKEKLLDLFARLRETFPGKPFIISEVCLPDEKRMKKLSYPHAEHELFHDLTFQKSFKSGELEKLLREAGFTVKNSWSLRNLGARIFIHFEA
jgi:Methyltransferase domain